MNRFLILLILAGLAEAHSGSRLYPFYELTDEMLETIDIHDGLIDEWYEIGEPSMTLLDFQNFQNRDPIDPSNLDFRIWLAWHDEPDRIYAAFIIADDEYQNEHDYEMDPWMFDHDSIVFQLDADHSGGSGRERGWGASDAKFMRLLGETQRYSAVARTVNGPILLGNTRFLEGSSSLRRRGGYGSGRKPYCQRNRDVCHSIRLVGCMGRRGPDRIQRAGRSPDHRLLHRGHRKGLRR